MKVFKRLGCFVLALVMCLGLFPGSVLAAMQSVKITTKGQVVDSITFNGVTVDAIYAPPNSISNYSSNATYCCAAFVSKFYQKVYGIGVDHLSRKYNGPHIYSGSGSFSVTSDPQIGDIVWRKTSTSTHWAIVKKVGATDVTLIEQNAWYSKENGTARVGKTYSKTDPYVTFYHYNLNTTGSNTSNDNTTSGTKQSTVAVTFSNYQVRVLTETVAEPYATVESTGDKVTEVGMYIGATKENMTKLGSDNGAAKYKKNMWYNTQKYGYPLEPGTTYYYQPYTVVGGKTYKGDIKSFTTKGEKVTPSPAPTPESTSTPTPTPTPAPTPADNRSWQDQGWTSKKPTESSTLKITDTRTVTDKAGYTTYTYYHYWAKKDGKTKMSYGNTYWKNYEEVTVTTAYPYYKTYDGKYTGYKSPSVPDGKHGTIWWLKSTNEVPAQTHVEYRYSVYK